MTTRRGFLTGGTWCPDHNHLVDTRPAEEVVWEACSPYVVPPGAKLRVVEGGWTPRKPAWGAEMGRAGLEPATYGL